jgi:hypothetical protein
MPVTVANIETLKRLKSYLNNSTEENRLNRLVRLSIRREISIISILSSEVVDIFLEKKYKINALKKKSKLLLLLFFIIVFNNFYIYMYF